MTCDILFLRNFTSTGLAPTVKQKSDLYNRTKESSRWQSHVYKKIEWAGGKNGQKSVVTVVSFKHSNYRKSFRWISEYLATATTNLTKNDSQAFQKFLGLEAQIFLPPIFAKPENAKHRLTTASRLYHKPHSFLENVPWSLWNIAINSINISENIQTLQTLPLRTRIRWHHLLRLKTTRHKIK